MNIVQLFVSFLQVGLFSIGGGYAAIPLIQNQAVQIHHWITEEQFLDLATIAEMTPGPIAVNAATFVGLRVSGVPGAVTATFGCILPSLVIVSVLAVLYRKYRKMPLLQSVLSSLRPAVVALILAAGINMLMQVVFGGMDKVALRNTQWLRLTLFVAAFLALCRGRKNPIAVMLVCGIVNLIACTTGL